MGPVIEYILETANGKKVVKHYQCRNREDFLRCVKIHKSNCGVCILTVDDKLFDERKVQV